MHDLGYQGNMPINCVYSTLQDPFQAICHPSNLLWGHVPQRYDGFTENFVELIPRELVTGCGVYFKKHWKAQLVSYVKSHEDIVVPNNQHPRAYTGIYLGPRGNIQGKLKVFDLKTGVVEKPWTMTELPIPYRCITLVDKWANWSIREYTQSSLGFLNCHK